jgi:SPP1 family predicted phage head-tail adaptor
MEAGDLIHRVRLQAPSRATNGAGETDVTWADPGDSVWARVEPLKGWQLERAQQINVHTTHRVTIRYREGVATDWRILWGDRVLNVTGIVDDGGRHIWLELSCEQEGGQTS